MLCLSHSTISVVGVIGSSHTQGSPTRPYVAPLGRVGETHGNEVARALALCMTVIT